MEKPICIGCNKSPDEISEYRAYSVAEDLTPDEYVREYEGTYNKRNGHFTCTECYIKMGQPSTPFGWKAP